MKLFQSTYKEPGFWRWWLKNGQSVEIATSRHGWDFGGGIHIHSNDNDKGDRLLFLKFWRLTAVLPLGLIEHPWPPMEGPQWSAYASEFGLTFHWGFRRKSLDWPWTLHTLHYQKQLPDGSWRSVFDRDAKPYVEQHPYTYTLRSGEIQKRTAEVSKRRHILCRKAFKFLKWPTLSKESIEVTFSDEVGERSGSRKGGVIGCGYALKKGETILDCLRRMERERKFK